MDSDRFDALSRHLGVRATRRGASALGALLLATLAVPQTGEAQVQAEMCIKPGRRCKKKQGKHRKKMRCCGQASCRKGRCRCKRGLQNCQGKCISQAECCGGCPTGQTCVGARCVGCGQGGDCIAFATSTLHSGNLGGLAGADAICQQRATAAGLGGAYKAWLSDATASPATRFVQNPGRYVRTDGLPIAADWAALVSGVILINLDRTETGQFINSDREAWTNTAPDGTPYATNPNLLCSEWGSGSSGVSGRVGEVDQVDEDWTSSHSDACDDEWRLYCFQQS